MDSLPASSFRRHAKAAIHGARARTSQCAHGLLKDFPEASPID
jgi:hypothetical protein